MSGSLIKPAKRGQVVGNSTGCNRLAAFMGKPEPHPVNAFVGGANEGFIRMLAKTIMGEEHIKFPYGLA